MLFEGSGTPAFYAWIWMSEFFFCDWVLSIVFVKDLICYGFFTGGLLINYHYYSIHVSVGLVSLKNYFVCQCSSDFKSCELGIQLGTKSKSNYYNCFASLLLKTYLIKPSFLVVVYTLGTVLYSFAMKFIHLFYNCSFISMSLHLITGRT